MSLHNTTNHLCLGHFLQGLHSFWKGLSVFPACKACINIHLTSTARILAFSPFFTGIAGRSAWAFLMPHSSHLISGLPMPLKWSSSLKCYFTTNSQGIKVHFPFLFSPFPPFPCPSTCGLVDVLFCLIHPVLSMSQQYNSLPWAANSFSPIRRIVPLWLKMLFFPSHPFLPFFFLFSSFSQQSPLWPRLQWLSWPLSSHPLRSGFQSHNPLTGFFLSLPPLGSQPKVFHNKTMLDTPSGFDLYFCRGYKYYLLHSSPSYLAVYPTSTHFNFLYLLGCFLESPLGCLHSFPLWLLALRAVLALLPWTVARIWLYLCGFISPFSSGLTYSDNPVHQWWKSYMLLPHSSIKFKLLKMPSKALYDLWGL